MNTAERELVQDVQEFELRAYRTAPPDLQVGALRQAVEDFRRRSKAYRWDVTACHDHARSLQEPTPLHERAAQDFVGNLDPDTAVRAEAVLEELAPRVREVREAIFDSPDAPFASLEEAVAWIELEAERKVAKKEGMTDQLVEETLVLEERWGRCIGAPASLRLSRPILEYLKPTGNGALVSCVKVCFGSPLLKLKQFTGAASMETEFDEHALVSHVLFGKCPGLSRISIGHRVGISSYRPRRTTITLLNRHVTMEELERVYAIIQRLRRRKHPSGLLDATDKAICEVIRKMGKLPHPKVPYAIWKNIAEELKLGFPKLTPAAVRVRVRRMENEKGLPRKALYQGSSDG